MRYLQLDQELQLHPGDQLGLVDPTNRRKLIIKMYMIDTPSELSNEI